jgi:hypothetical protein
MCSSSRAARESSGWHAELSRTHEREAGCHAPHTECERAHGGKRGGTQQLEGLSAREAARIRRCQHRGGGHGGWGGALRRHHSVNSAASAATSSTTCQQMRVSRGPMGPASLASVALGCVLVMLVRGPMAQDSKLLTRGDSRSQQVGFVQGARRRTLGTDTAASIEPHDQGLATASATQRCGLRTRPTPTNM